MQSATILNKEQPRLPRVIIWQTLWNDFQIQMFERNANLAGLVLMYIPTYFRIIYLTLKIHNKLPTYIKIIR